MRPFTLLLLALLGLLQYQLWFGKNSIRDYIQVSEQVDRQRQSNAQLVRRNQLLREEVTSLKSGIEAIEERARNELGMIRPDETFYRLIPNDD